MEPHRSLRPWSRGNVSNCVERYLKQVKGLGSSNNLRRCTITRKRPQPTPPPPVSDPRIHLIFCEKKIFTSARVKLRPGSIKSSDEKLHIIESSSRLLIPRQYYDRTVEKYDGTAEIYRELKLRETEEFTRQFQDLSERLFPTNQRKRHVKSKVYLPRSQTPPPSAPLQTRLNTIFDLIDSVQAPYRRSQTPSPLRPPPRSNPVP